MLYCIIVLFNFSLVMLIKNLNSVVDIVLADFANENPLLERNFMYSI